MTLVINLQVAIFWYFLFNFWSRFRLTLFGCFNRLGLLRFCFAGP